MPANARKYFGDLIHRYLLLFYKRKWQSKEKFIKSWRFYWYNQVMPDGKFYQAQTVKFRCEAEPHILANLGTDILSRFWKENHNQSRSLYLEKYFSVAINVWQITGRWDRIEKKDEGYVIVDYKSGIFLPEPNDGWLEKNIQFTAYSLAFREVFGVKEKRIDLYHLRTGKRLTTYRTEKDYQQFFEKLTEMEQRLQEKDFSSTGGFYCQWCDFLDYCQENHPVFGRKS